jgi:hypothetical protein
VIDDRDLEDRLRRTLRYVASLPLGELDTAVQPMPTSRAARSHALWRRAAIVLTSIAVVIAAVVASLEISHRGPTRPAPAVPVPADVTGVPQVLKVEASIPLSDFGFTPAQVVAGSEHTFGLGSLQFSTVYENETSSVKADSGYQANLNITTPGVGGTACGVPFTPSRYPLPGVCNVHDEPRQGDQLVVWIGLPAGTAFVTYTYRGGTYWERSQSGVAAFVAPQQAVELGTTNESLTSLERRRALPEMDAYDVAGRLLMRYFVYAPGGVTVYPNQ